VAPEEILTHRLQSIETCQLVSFLPEMYQPIFGHSDLSANALRASDDRLAYITEAYLALGKELGRPLRVLDLGCAQGYIALHVAALGAKVHGVEGLFINYAVCMKLALENPQLSLTFEHGRVEDAIEALRPNEYDLVLGLSIFHHIIKGRGLDVVQGYMKHISECCSAGIFEMAMAQEPLSWADAQPTDVRTLLTDFAFVHEIARTPNHLSSQQRPLFFASNRYWYLSGDCRQFLEWKDMPHGLNPGLKAQQRRYYIGETLFAKLFSLDSSAEIKNRRDIEKESEALSKIQSLSGMPALIKAGSNLSETWLVREQIPGMLLLDAIEQNYEYDDRRVISDILDQLCELEKIGLYHDDLRVWNIMLKPDGGASIIDFSSVQSTPADACWPGNLFLVFWIFVWGTVRRTADWKQGTLPPMLSAVHLPNPYRSWSQTFWETEPRHWTFTALRESFRKIIIDRDELGAAPRVLTAMDMWKGTIEQLLYDVIRLQSSQAEVTGNALDSTIGLMQSLCSHLEARNKPA
jgi:O-antigen chain-terminating methyltransferase